MGSGEGTPPPKPPEEKPKNPLAAAISKGIASWVNKPESQDTKSPTTPIELQATQHKPDEVDDFLKDKLKGQ